MRGRNGMKIFGSGLGRPSLGSRACRCRIAAPACAASIAWLAIWSGVIGSASDMVGVWIEPVTAQLMITLLDFCGMRFLQAGQPQRAGQWRRLSYKQEDQSLPTSWPGFWASPAGICVGKRPAGDILGTPVVGRWGDPP